MVWIQSLAWEHPYAMGVAKKKKKKKERKKEKKPNHFHINDFYSLGIKIDIKQKNHSRMEFPLGHSGNESGQEP